MMWQDDIIQEIRQIREVYAQKFHFDITAICADVRERQTQHSRTLVKFPPKRIRLVLTKKSAKVA